MDNTKIVDGLNDLLKKNYDSERGFKNAAEKTDNRILSAFYKNKASQRYTFGHQIKEHISNLNGTPDKGTSIPGDMHNSWINFRTIFSLDKDEAILNAVESGEEASLTDYNRVLEMDNMPFDVRLTIAQQRMQIENALSRVDAFENHLVS